MPINEAKKKAYDVAIEATKQQITLSTAVLTLTCTLLKDILRHPNALAIGLVAGAWLAFIASIAFGTRTLFQIAGILGRVRNDNDKAVPPIIRVPGIRTSARAQNGFFLAALALIVAFGAANLPW